MPTQSTEEAVDDFFRNGSTLGFSVGEPVWDPMPGYGRIWDGEGTDHTGLDITNTWPFGSAPGQPICFVAVGRNEFDGMGGISESHLHCFNIFTGTPPFTEHAIQLPPDFVQDLSFVEINGILYCYVLFENWGACRTILYRVSCPNNIPVFTQVVDFGPFLGEEATAIATVLDGDSVYIYIVYARTALVRTFRHRTTALNLPPVLLSTDQSGLWGPISPGSARAPFGIGAIHNPMVTANENHQHIVTITSNATTGQIEVYRANYVDYDFGTPPDWQFETLRCLPFWCDWYAAGTPGNPWVNRTTNWNWYTDQTPYYPSLKHVDIDYLYNPNYTNNENDPQPRVRISVAYPNIGASHLEMFKADLSGVDDLDALCLASPLNTWFSIDNYSYYPADTEKVSRSWSPVTAVAGQVFDNIAGQDWYGVCAVHGGYQFWSFWADWVDQ